MLPKDGEIQKDNIEKFKKLKKVHAKTGKNTIY